ncbi:MAG: putative inorganic carbon transporter subunit DabA, partial [Actinomycetota bacterium]
ETEIDRGRLTADVARAGALIAPMWPLSSFVAVNPLGGLEPDGFEQAVADGERWLRGRTVPTLHAFRTGHALGRSTEADLERAVRHHASEACGRPAIESGGRTIGADEIVLADLLYGPENASIEIPRTRLEAIAGVRVADQLGIDEMVADWVASYLTGVGWPVTAGTPRLVTVAHTDLQALAARRLTPPAVAWLDTLEPHAHSAVEVLAASLEIMGVEPDDRVDEIRGHLAAVSGWAGIAKWRSDWAHADEALPPLRLVDIAAVRAMTTAAVLVGIGAVGAMSANRSTPVQPVSDDPAAALRAGRIDAVAAHFDLSSDDDRAAIGEILDLVAPSSRPLMWLTAHESNFDERMLTLLDRPSRPTTDERPDAQIVLCIDVRSEGFRRNLEALGRDETLGFAGFFGVPMSVQESGWSKPEARCPVLVSPSVTATERARFDAVDAVADRLMRARTVGALSSAHGATKHLAGAAFAAAETVGWFTGPAAAVRTFAPSKSLPDARQDGTTTIELGDDMLTEQRLFAAESVLRTMGLVERFAPVVVLCGHTSATTNNPHATALECGACAGAGGASNARTVAALLNEPDVRVGLVERGIEIPDDTWFLAGVHETVSDTVTLLDVDAAPAESADAIVALSDRLERAANANSAVRARHLPGPDETVRTRGNDWAQVRPEWGLATNAAFVIGPRAMTEDLDLAGRAFLHSYRPDRDPEGAVLEAIMTAPLVVGHWISSQYFFSTVDAEAFGAGDKLLHNPIGTIGVLSGAGGDLRVGLPLQSTHVDGRPHHQPVRLLAVIEADLTVIDEIIERNAILTQLVGGGWIRIAARATPDEPWSTRSADGTWSALPRRIDIHPTLEIS